MIQINIHILSVIIGVYDEYIEMCAVSVPYVFFFFFLAGAPFLIFLFFRYFFFLLFRFDSVSQSKAPQRLKLYLDAPGSSCFLCFYLCAHRNRPAVFSRLQLPSGVIGGDACVSTHSDVANQPYWTKWLECELYMCWDYIYHT